VDTQSYTNWLLSEPVRGIRAYWNGSRLEDAYTHHVIPAPHGYTSSWPNIEIEGIIKSDSNQIDWKTAQFIVTDTPSMKDSSLQDRLEWLRKMIPSNGSIRMAQVLNCPSNIHFYAMLSKFQHDLLLRDPKSLYYQRRNTFTLRKFTTIPMKIAKEQRNSFVECTSTDGTVIRCASKDKLSNDQVVQIRNTLNVFSFAEKPAITLDWKQILKMSYPYHLEVGKSAHAACRGCFTRIPKEKLRVRTILLRDCGRKLISPVKISFCADVACIQTGLKRYSEFQVKPFLGEVWVDSNVKKQHGIPIVNSGITWKIS